MDLASQGHRERLRRKYRQAGLNALHDYEQLELLLTFVIPRKDVKPLARNLLQTFKTFSGVFDATHDELAAVAGIGDNAAALIKLVKDVCGKYLQDAMEQAVALASPAAVIDFARMALSGMKNETFMVIYLNVKNRVIGHELSHGTIDHAAVYPRNIVQEALRRNAAAVILVHNHPSGHCAPSSEDIALTAAVKSACKTVGVNLLDHLVVGRGGYASLAEQSLL